MNQVEAQSSPQLAGSVNAAERGVLLRGTSLMVAQLGAAFALRFVFQIGLSYMVSPAVFGIVVFAESVLLLASLVVTSSFGWHVTRRVSAGDYSAVRASASGMVVLTLLTVLFIMGPMFAARGDGSAAESGILLLIVGGALMFAAVNEINYGVLRGDLRFSSLAAGRFVAPALIVVIGLSAAAAGAGSAAIVLSYLAGNFVALAVTLRLVGWRRAWQGPWISLSPYRSSIPLLFGILGPQLILFLDLIGLRLFAPAFTSEPDNLTALYRTAALLVHVPVLLVITGVGVLFPLIARERGALERKAFTRLAVLVYLVVAAPAFIVMYMNSDLILGLFFPDFYLAASTMLAILVPGMFGLGACMIFAWNLQAEGTLRPVALTGGAMAILLWVLLWIFVPRGGAEAAAWSTTAASLFGTAGLTVIYVRLRGFPIRFVTLLKLLVAFGVLIAALYAGNQFAASWLAEIVAVTGALSVYLISLFLLRVISLPAILKSWRTGLRGVLASPKTG